MPQFDRFTGQARRAIWLAYQEAQRFDHDYLASEHLLAGLLREGTADVASAFRDQDIEPAEILERLEASLAQATDGSLATVVSLTPRATQALLAAAEAARARGDERAGAADLLLALILDRESAIAGFLEDAGFDLEQAAAALRSAVDSPNRDLLVTASTNDSARPDGARVDPTAAQLAELFAGVNPYAEIPSPLNEAAINPILAETDFQLFLTQLMLAVTMGLAGGFILYQSVDAMAAAAILLALVACFRNSVLGMCAGATLGGMIAQKVQNGNHVFDSPIEALVPLTMIGAFLGSFIGGFWRRFTPKYLHPSTMHQKPPGVV